MKPVSFYLVTDTHYFENKLGAEGKAFEKKMTTEQYFVRESSAIVKSTFSFLPDFVTKEYIDSGELCYLDIKDMNMEIWKQLIYHKNKWMSKTLRTLIT